MKICKRLLTGVLVLCLLLSCLPVLSVSAAGDAMSASAVRALLNGVELHPQRTGYAELDEMLEKILAPYAGSDNYTKLKAAYDWTIREIDYDWAPYSQNWAPAYDCFVPQHTLQYDESLQEAMPWEIINRTYHSMAYHEGICYDYAAVFAVMARYIGVDAFVHTGYFTFEAGFGTGAGHHGWTELCIDGKYYIFDPQRDYRMSANGTAAIPYYYFGIPSENAWRYSPETKVNAARDAGFLPVAAERQHYAMINAEASPSGTAEGGGKYPLGERVILTAQGEAEFVGWYDKNGELCSTNKVYAFPAEESGSFRAVFAGEFFKDVPTGAWYSADVSEAWERGIIQGISPFVFSSGSELTRAMAVTMLARALKADTEATEAPFADVAVDTWYADAVAWAKEQEIVEGIGSGLFVPKANVTREQYVVMLMRCAAASGKTAEPTDLSYEDSEDISAYAVELLQSAQTAGLLKGYSDGTFRPQGSLTRAEGATFLMRWLRWMEL